MDFTNAQSILMNVAHENVSHIFRSKNRIKSLIMTFLVTSSLSALINWIRRFHFSSILEYALFRYIRKRFSFLFKKRNELIFEATYIPQRNGNTFMDTTKAFDALLDYLKLNNITNGVHSKAEIKRSPTERMYYDEAFDDYKLKEDNRLTYAFSAGTIIKLPDNITIEFSSRQEHNNESVDGKSVETTRRVSVITVHSYKRSMNELEEFVSKIHDDYSRKVSNKFNNQMYYFNYYGISKDRIPRQSWKCYPFDTVKTYGNFFCEDKERIFTEIANLRNAQPEYERCGKPYQITIFIHGNDFGCGKTSLLRLLCKMFGNGEKKRHIININLSKVKTCSELEDIFLCNEEIMGQRIPNEERIYIFDELDKVSDILLTDDHKDDTLFKKMKGDLISYMKTDKVDKKKEETFKDLFECQSLMSGPSSKQEDDKLNLGFILQLLDGPIEFPKRIIFATANEIDKLHPALIRPGRFDMKIHLKRASRDVARDIITYNFNLNDIPEEIEMKMKDIPEYKHTPSDIISECFANKRYGKSSKSDKIADMHKCLDNLLTE